MKRHKRKRWKFWYIYYSLDQLLPNIFVIAFCCLFLSFNCFSILFFVLEMNAASDAEKLDLKTFKMNTSSDTDSLDNDDDDKDDDNHDSSDDIENLYMVIKMKI